MSHPPSTPVGRTRGSSPNGTPEGPYFKPEQARERMLGVERAQPTQEKRDLIFPKFASIPLFSKGISKSNSNAFSLPSSQSAVCARSATSTGYPTSGLHDIHQSVHNRQVRRSTSQMRQMNMDSSLSESRFVYIN